MLEVVFAAAMMDLVRVKVVDVRELERLAQTMLL